MTQNYRETRQGQDGEQFVKTVSGARHFIWNNKCLVPRETRLFCWAKLKSGYRSRMFNIICLLFFQNHLFISLCGNFVRAFEPSSKTSKVKASASNISTPIQSDAFFKSFIFLWIMHGFGHKKVNTNAQTAPSARRTRICIYFFMTSAIEGVVAISSEARFAKPPFRTAISPSLYSTSREQVSFPSYLFSFGKSETEKLFLLARLYAEPGEGERGNFKCQAGCRALRNRMRWDSN